MEFSLNLGIRAHDMDKNRFDEVAKNVHRYGLNHVQLAPMKQFSEYLSDFKQLSPGFANQQRQALSKNNVDISVLGCYINMVSPDERLRNSELQKYFDHLRLAKNFGATLVGTETGTVGNGFTLDNYSEEVYQEMLSSIRKMVLEAEKWGVTVGIEPGINHPLNTVEKTMRLLAEIPSNHLQIILDPVNLLYPDTINNQTEITEHAIHSLGDRVAVFHLKDYQVVKGKIIFVPVGKGNMNIEPIIKYAKYHRPSIQISLEDTKESDLITSLKYIQEVYERV